MNLRCDTLDQSHSGQFGWLPTDLGQPLAAEARPVRNRGHRIKHDTRMLERPPGPVGAVDRLIRAAHFFALVPQPPGNAHAGRADLLRIPISRRYSYKSATAARPASSTST